MPKTPGYLAALEQSAIVTKTDLEGTITFANAEFCELCGYSEAELLGQNHNIIRHPDTPREYFEKMWRTILAGRVHKGVVKNLRKNGEAFWAQTLIIPIKEGGAGAGSGKITGFAAFRHDLTPQFAAQEQLLEQQKLLADAMKSAALGQMVSSIAHQWRQPLHELGLELYLLKNGSASSYERSRALLTKMSAMIENLSIFTHDEGAAQEVAIKQILRPALEIMRMTIKKSGLKISFEGDFSLRVKTRANDLAQALANIVQNTCEACADQEEKRLLIVSKQITNGLELQLHDNGCGIAEPGRVFERLYTTKSRAGGGLGLHISEQLVQHCGGQISVIASRLGGAAFKIYLRNI